MRKTNLQKWEEAQQLLEVKKKDFLSSQLNGREITEFYKSTKNEVKTIQVEKISVRCEREPYKNERVTREDLSRLYHVIDNFEEIEKKVFIHYTEKSGNLNTRGAHRLSELESPEGYSVYLCKETAQKQHAHLKERFGEKEGHEPCAYCGTQTPVDKMISRSIIFQNSSPSRGRFVDRKTNKYCSQKCGSYDQMAHEG